MPFLLSFLWGVADHEQWPIAWTSGVNMLRRVGWLPPPHTLPTPTSTTARSCVISAIRRRSSMCCSGGSRPRGSGWNPSLLERVRLLVEIDERRADGLYASVEEEAEAEACARSVVGDMSLLGAIEDRVSNVMNRGVRTGSPPLVLAPGRYRTDGWVQWTANGLTSKPTLIVWATRNGAMVGLTPGWMREGFYEEQERHWHR